MNETEHPITVFYDGACPIRTLAVVCFCLLHALCRHTRASRVLLRLRWILFQRLDGAAGAPARPLAEHQADPEFAGWIWAVVEVAVERYFGPAEKINITLPRRLLAKIDERVRARGETRSGFLAEAARAAMR